MSDTERRPHRIADTSQEPICLEVPRTRGDELWDAEVRRLRKEGHSDPYVQAALNVVEILNSQAQTDQDTNEQS